MEKKRIGLFIGSLRKESFSRKIANNIIRMSSDDFGFSIVEIGQLPFYNQDFDDYNNDPESFIQFRQEVAALDGVIFVTPEYNRSLPAVLKNAIDMASRPYGKNVWSGKPGAVLSSSIGPTGGFGANHHLRQVLTFVNVYTMQQPEAYLSNIANGCFEEETGLFTDRTYDFVKRFVDAYIGWFKQLTK